MKRLSAGFLFQAEYSYTRSRDNAPTTGGAQNPNNEMADYGNTDSVPRQALVFNYLYDLPVGRGRKFDMSQPDSGRGRRRLVAFRHHRLSHRRAALGQLHGAFQHHRLVGRPRRCGCRAVRFTRANPSSHDVVRGVQWFNPGGLCAAAALAVGQLRAEFASTVRAPGTGISECRSASSITEHHRVQIRADFLDAFNHFNLGTPSATIADTRDGGLPNANAGKIFGGSGNRVIQLGMKYKF